MSATDHFRAGQLQSAIDAQIQDVKAHPADPAKRLFLFELLAFAGEWDRARRQIEAVTYPEPDRDAAVQQYKVLVDAEEHRARVFRDGVMPEFLIPAPQWVYHRLAAVNALRAGNTAEAQALLDKAVAEAAPVAGKLNGKAVGEFRDADDRFGPILEVVAHGHYYWVPLEQVKGFSANAPKFPRDLIWLPIKLAVRDGPSGDAYLLARYPARDGADDQVKLGRVTNWIGDDEEGPVFGVGLRMMVVGDDLVPVLECREYRAAERPGATPDEGEAPPS
jgi:type VI secretion system protein ImpE